MSAQGGVNACKRWKHCDRPDIGKTTSPIKWTWSTERGLLPSITGHKVASKLFHFDNARMFLSGGIHWTVQPFKQVSCREFKSKSNRWMSAKNVEFSLKKYILNEVDVSSTKAQGISPVSCVMQKTIKSAKKTSWKTHSLELLRPYTANN